MHQRLARVLGDRGDNMVAEAYPVETGSEHRKTR